MITTKITGMKEARKRMQFRSRAIRGLEPVIYYRLSLNMQKAIDENADISYTQSPAKDMALKSALKWVRKGALHSLRIMSTLYANYRQYGCGGIPIKKLVILLPHNIDEMKQRILHILVRGYGE
jgi:hypothetical protein